MGISPVTFHAIVVHPSSMHLSTNCCLSFSLELRQFTFRSYIARIESCKGYMFNGDVHVSTSPRIRACMHAMAIQCDVHSQHAHGCCCAGGRAVIKLSSDSSSAAVESSAAASAVAGVLKVGSF